MHVYFIDKTNDIIINKIKYFTLIIIKIILKKSNHVSQSKISRALHLGYF